MPHALDLQVPTESPTGAPGGDYEHIQTSPEMFGGYGARALGELGTGVEKAAVTGLDVATERALLAGKVNVDDQVNQWITQVDNLSYGDPTKKTTGPDGKLVPDTGFFGLQGRAASDQRESALRSLEDARQQGRNNLRNPREQLEYDIQTRRIFADRTRQFGAHAEKEWKHWAAGVNGSKSEWAMANYLRNLDDERMMNQYAQSYIAAKLNEAELKFGDDPDIHDQAIADAQQQLLKQRVMQVGANDPIGAQKILDQYKDVAGRDYPALSDHLRGRKEDQTGNAAGNQAVASAVGGVAPQGEIKPVAGIPGSFVRATRNMEGFDATPKWDVKQWTIGFGTRASGPNDRASMPELEARYQKEYEQAAAIVEKVNPNLDPGTKAALTSLTYNTGGAWTQGGLGDAVRNGDLATARQLFLQYNKVAGKFSSAIANRRMVEAGWFGKEEPGGGPTPLQSAGAIKAAGYRAILESTGLNDRERDIAFRRVDRAYNEAIIADELKMKADADSRDRSLIQYQRLLKQAYESENPTEAIRQVLDAAYEDEGLAKAADRPELERIARQFFQFDPPEKYGTGYVDLLSGVFKGEGEEGYTGPVQIAKAFGDGVLTKSGFDRLNTTYERAHKNHEYAASHAAFSNMLQKYREQMGKEQMIPGLTTPITNLAGLAKFHDLAARMSAEFDQHMTKAGANPYEFINNSEYWDKVRDEIYPPSRRAMDELGSLQANKGAGQAIPPAPEGVPQKAWEEVMATRPVIEGQLWGAEWWQKAIEQLRANPDAETMAAFKRNFPAFDPQAIITKLGVERARKAIKTEQPGGFAPAVAAPEPERRTGFERGGTAKPFGETVVEAIQAPEAQRPPPHDRRPVMPAQPKAVVPSGPPAETLRGARETARAVHDALTRALTPEPPRRLKHPPAEE